jgi:hypothetical protein
MTEKEAEVLRMGLRVTSDAFAAACRTMDSEKLRSQLRIFAQFMTEPLQEPIASVVDTSLTSACTELARLALDHFDWDGCIQLLALSKRTLEAKAVRRKKLKLQSRPDNENWCRLIQVLADMLWKAPLRYERTLMQPEILLDLGLDKINNLLERLASQEQSDEHRVCELMTLATWTASKLVNVAIRYCPSELLQRFRAEVNGTVLASLDDVDQAYYWDQMIADAWINGGASSAIDHYYQLRDELIQAQRSEDDLSALLAASQREQDYLSKSSPGRLMLLIDKRAVGG